jgi:hypothetical protein
MARICARCGLTRFTDTGRHRGDRVTTRYVKNGQQLEDRHPPPCQDNAQ